MFSKAGFVIKYWVSWIIFFEIARLIFLLSNYRETRLAGLHTSFLSMFYGLRMDLSAAAYLTLPVSVLILLSVFVKKFNRLIIYKAYTAVVLMLLMIILFADAGLYKAWGFRIDATPLKYLASPQEAWASVNHLPIFSILLGFAVLYSIFLILSKRLLAKWSFALISDPRKLVSFSTLLLLTAAFIIPLRGGIQQNPLNQSSVYFSQNNFANMAALNAAWNLLQAIGSNANRTENPFIVDDSVKVNRTTDSLISKSSSFEQLIKFNKASPPNVIVIMWESLTSKAINLQVEGKTITPGFNKLMNEGIYFSDIYATGDRTDKGIVAVLSGYPAQAITSIVKEPVKAAKLPMMSTLFKKRNYSTSFYYGGEIEFANMKAYLLQGSFDNFVTIVDFDKKDQNSKWGAHDGVLLDRMKQDLKEMHSPFFTTCLTLSSHEPFETPATKLLPGKDLPSRFLSSVNYTDSVVYSFIQYAKLQPWWDNTIVVIVADHGHRLPESAHKPDDFKIPLLFLGGAIQQPYRNIATTGSQIDIAGTLLPQLNMPSQQFKWSRNLFDSTRSPWAFFTFNNGFGFMQPGKKLVYDNVGKLIMERSGPITEKDIYNGRALQQAAFQDYLNK